MKFRTGEKRIRGNTVALDVVNDSGERIGTCKIRVAALSDVAELVAADQIIIGSQQ